MFLSRLLSPPLSHPAVSRSSTLDYALREHVLVPIRPSIVGAIRSERVCYGYIIAHLGELGAIPLGWLRVLCIYRDPSLELFAYITLTSSLPVGAVLFLAIQSSLINLGCQIARRMLKE